MKKLIPFLVIILTVFACSQSKIEIDDEMKTELGIDKNDYWSNYKSSLFQGIVDLQSTQGKEDYNQRLLLLNKKIDSVLYSPKFFSVYLSKQVLDVHDEVMPKIGEVMNLRKKVLEKADSMEDESADALRDLAQRLDDANKSMMTWMRDWSGSYSKIMESDDIEAQKAWFAEEMDKVQEVKEKINSSLEEAKKELE